MLVVPCGVSATVSDATYKSTSVCNGTATSYTFTFGVGATSEVKVTTTVSATGVETTLTETTDYSVLCTNSDCTSGGTVVLTSGSKCPSGSTLTLEMNVPYTQTSDFTEGMPTLYETFEDGLDKLTRITQQLKGRVEDAETDIASVTPATATGVYYYRLADYGSISSAVSAIGTERAVLLCDAAITLSDDPTVLSTTTFQAVQGCMITTTGHTVTIPVIEAGPYQIFSGSGTVSGLKESTPDWFAVNTTPGTTDMLSAIQSAITAAPVVKLQPNTTYAIDTTTTGLLIPSYTTLDLNGSTIKRIGSDIDHKMIQNENYGVSTDYDIVIKNGTFQGTGAAGTVSNQGACIGFYKVDGVLLENITTVNSNGDGISAGRNAENVTLRKIRIGDYGRNGISMSDGSFFWDDVQVTGAAITGASPGAYIDIENNNATETTTHVMNNVVAPRITFADLHNTGGGAFAHKAKITNCKFGPQYYGMKFVSTNATIATDIIIGDTNIIHIGPAITNSYGLWIDNVSGIVFNGKVVDDLTATNKYGVLVLNTVNNLKMTGARLDSTLTVGILASKATDLLGSSYFSGCELGKVYLTGSDNRFTGCNISVLTISRAASTGNIFDASTTIGSKAVANGASLVNQEWGNFRVIDHSSVTTDGTGEDDLKTYTLKEDSLTANGGIRIRAAGTKTNSNGNKTIKLHFGGTAWTFNAAANDTNDWSVDAEVWNIAVNSQRVRVLGWNGTTPYHDYGLASEATQSGDITIKITGECANASDVITQTMWTIERLGQ